MANPIYIKYGDFHPEKEYKIVNYYNSLYDQAVCLVIYNDKEISKTWHELSDCQTVYMYDHTPRLFFFFKPTINFINEFSAVYILNQHKIQKINYRDMETVEKSFSILEQWVTINLDEFVKKFNPRLPCDQ